MFDVGLGKEHSISPDQLMWQQRDQELALTRERERATKEKERQRREREGIWPGIGGIGVLNDHIELDKESYSYVQFAREGISSIYHFYFHRKRLNGIALQAIPELDCILSIRCTSTAIR